MAAGRTELCALQNTGWHCSQCQPHLVEMVMCGLCSVTVLLGGDLANKAEQTLLLEPAARWLTDRGWRQNSKGWECGSHRQFPVSL